MAARPLVCVHGHFYQPPRENPWLEAIEPQDSAAPYHDWNARITAECYEPNTASRILDDDDRIVSIVNNYSRISFNFGPTLLSWLEREQPSVYSAILEADRESQKRFGGHGSALAQAYNHTILPLATPEEREVQVVWGIRDFEHRFGRKPDGMWLPETAVDLKSLEALAAHGIRFTVLAPSQARRVRVIGDHDWTDVSGGRVDPTRPCIQHLPSGESIVLFFYDGGLSRGVAFDGLLHRGEHFAQRLAGAAPEGEGRLVHIATDGESYGHHHRHGDMALAYALNAIESRGWGELTNYAWFLARFPPTHEVEIFENSSWSCAHGVERWRSDCGCSTGGPAEWTQAWRTPLRDALDWLRNRAAELSHEEAARCFKNPTDALHHFIELILDRTPENVDRFLQQHRKGRRTSNTDTDVRALKLLELQRQLQLMYTSCGWFFSELSGIETIQVLQYTGRAVQLAEDLSGESIEDGFLERLGHAHSNRAEAGSGHDIYERSVRPAKVNWEMLGAHYAMASFFETYPETTMLYCYEVERDRYHVREAGKTKLAIGRARLTSRITRATEDMSFAVLYLGGHTVTTGVRRGSHALDRLADAFTSGDENEVRRLIDDRFGKHQYHLESLFGDEKRRIVDALLRSTLEDAEASHETLFEKHGATMRFLTELGVPVPAALSVAAEVVLNRNLRRALDTGAFDEELVGSLIAEAVTEGVRLDDASLAYTTRQSIDAIAARCFEPAPDRERLERLLGAVRVVLALPFEVDLWKVQNLYFRYVDCLEPTGSQANQSDEWRAAFDELGDRLSMRLPA